MQSDEQEIRQLVATWMAATKAGDIDAVLSLMADEQDGKGLLARDANMLSPMPESGQ